MDRFGANVKTLTKNGEGILMEIYVTYKCGCESSHEQEKNFAFFRRKKRAKGFSQL